MQVGPFSIERKRDGTWIVADVRTLTYGDAHGLLGALWDYLVSLREWRKLHIPDHPETSDTAALGVVWCLGGVIIIHVVKTTDHSFLIPLLFLYPSSISFCFPWSWRYARLKDPQSPSRARRHIRSIP